MSFFISALVTIALYRVVIWSSGGKVVYSKATTTAQNITLGIFIGLAVLSAVWMVVRAGW